MNPTKTLTLRIGHDSMAFLSSVDADETPVYQTYEMKGGMSTAANLREAFKTLPILAEPW